MNTSEVINRAADLLEERGWTQGAGWRGDGALCLEGALFAAAGLDRDEPFQFLKFYTDCPAYSAVTAYLGRNPQPAVGPILHALWQWNDGWSRTAEEVVEVLRAAALIEAAKENADTREPAGVTR